MGFAGFAPLAPTLIAVGGHLDPCRPEGLLLAKRLAEAGRPATLLAYPRLPHGLASLTHLYPAGRRAVAQIGRAAAALVGAEPPAG